MTDESPAITPPHVDLEYNGGETPLPRPAEADAAPTQPSFRETPLARPNHEGSVPSLPPEAVMPTLPPIPEPWADDLAANQPS